MNLDRRVLAGALGIALLAAACGGGGSSPAASPSPAASTAPAASSDTASAPAADSPAPSDSGFEPSYAAGAAPDLEALIPDNAGGTTYAKVSFDGASLGTAGLGVDSGALDPILRANGKTIADVRVAMATPATPSATDMSQIVAFQVKGIDASQLIPLFSADGSSSMTPATIAGKQVLQTAAAGFSSVAYVKGDVLFLVILANPTQTEAIVAALP